VRAATCRVTHLLQGGNRIGYGPGTRSLALALKTNTTLTLIDLVSAGCDREFWGDLVLAMCVM